MVWKLKLDDAGKIVIKDDLPVFVKTDGTEIAFDAEKSFDTVGRVMGEAKTFREGKEAAELLVKEFAGLNPTEVKRALQTVKDLTGKDVIDAGKLETVRLEAIKATEEKYKPFVDENGQLKLQLQDVTLGNAFANSEFIKTKIAEHVPRDMLQATFGRHFQMVDGKVVAKLNGNDIFSPTNPGQPASFDEALEVIVGQYQGKANILKGTGAGGTGSKGGAGGSGGMSGGKPVMSRQQFETLGPAERMSTVASHVITD